MIFYNTFYYSLNIYFMTVEESKTVKIGDLVKLKSGSPTMLVEEIKLPLFDCLLWDESRLDVKRVGNIDYGLLELVTK